MLQRIAVPLAAAIALTSCHLTTIAASSAYVTTPKERVDECQQICTGVGLKMTAMVVIMNSVGCVCEVQNAPASSPAPGASAAAGGAVIAAAAAATAAAQQAALQQQQAQQAAARSAQHY